MAKVITVLNYKGGAGKTTTVANLGTALWLLRKRVLLIDTDVQCNLSLLLGFRNNDSNGNLLPTVNEWLTDHPDGFKVYERYPGLYYIPGRKDPKINLERELSNEYHGEDILKEHLNDIKDMFDYILIDCSFLANMINKNALIASDSILIPCETASFSFQGLDQLYSEYLKTKKRANKDLQIEGILYTKYLKGTRFAKKMEQYMNDSEEFGPYIMKTKIRKCNRFDESPIENKSVFEKEVKSNGAEDYLSLAEELTGDKRPDNWKEIILKAWLSVEEDDWDVIGQLREVFKEMKAQHPNDPAIEKEFNHLTKIIKEHAIQEKEQNK